MKHDLKSCYFRKVGTTLHETVVSGSVLDRKPRVSGSIPLKSSCTHFILLIKCQPLSIAVDSAETWTQFQSIHYSVWHETADVVLYDLYCGVE